MADKKSKDKEMNEVELAIGQVLRWGVILATAVMTVGLLMLLFTGKTGYSGHYVPLAPEAIISGVLGLKAYAILMLGLFLLILTPVLRVVVSIYAFFIEKDMLYVWITTVVLVILVISMIIGYIHSA